MKIPKYINKKIDRINSLIEQAIALRDEVEQWAENNGADILSTDWYEIVRDDITCATGISLTEWKNILIEMERKLT